MKQKSAEQWLVDQKIVAMRAMSEEEAKMMGWNYRPIIIQLSNGIILYAMRDEEGNDGGALVGNTEHGEITFFVKDNKVAAHFSE